MKSYRLAAVLFFIVGICLFFNPKAYEKVYNGCFASAEYLYLQAGDYQLTVTYEGVPEGCEAVVRTDSLVNGANEQNTVFATSPIPAGSGEISFSFHVPQNVPSVWIESSLGDEFDIFLTLRLKSVQLMNRDNYVLGGIFLLAGLGILLLGRFAPKRLPKGPGLILMGIGGASSLPLFHDFLKQGHDMNFHLARLEGIYQAMAEGISHVLVTPNQMAGFGYLSGAMYPQLFLYPAALLRFTGCSTMLCYKLLIVAANTATAAIAFYSVKHLCRSEKIGLWASLLYTFSLYRLTDAYTRAALGELLAMAFFPLILWGIYEVLWGDDKKWPLLALGVTGVLQSHVLSLEMAVFFLILLFLCWLAAPEKSNPIRRILAGGKAACFTVLLNAFFLVPFLFFSGEDLQVFQIQNDLSASAAYFSQMFPFFAAADGNNLPSGMTQSEMPIAVGGVLLVCAVLFGVEYFRKTREKRTKADQIGMFCLLFGLLSVLLSSWLFPWKAVESVPFLDFVVSPLEFPWRYLGFASVFWSVAGAVGIESFASRAGKEWIRGVVFAAIVASTGFYFDQVSQSLPDVNDPFLILGLDDAFDSSYLYQGDSIGSFAPNNTTIQCTNDSLVFYEGYQKRGTSLSVHTFPLQYTEGARLVFPLYGYTGYRVTVNGAETAVYREGGRLACDLPREDAQIEVDYVGSPLFDAADWISFLTALASAALLLRKTLRK